MAPALAGLNVCSLRSSFGTPATEHSVVITAGNCASWVGSLWFRLCQLRGRSHVSGGEDHLGEPAVEGIVVAELPEQFCVV